MLIGFVSSVWMICMLIMSDHNININIVLTQRFLIANNI
jgi:hypothetical protein